MGMSVSGTSQDHYDLYKRRYTNCTYVDGNLEISHTRNSATVAAGSTLITITPAPPIQNESAPTPQSLGIVINWI